MSKLMYVVIQAQPQGQGYMTLVMLLAVVAIFYFFMIRPQMKKKKEMNKFRDELKVGDKVITIGGIYGKIAEISEQAVILEVEGKMRLKIDKKALIKDSSDLVQQR